MNKNTRTYRVMMIPERNGSRAVSFQISGFWITAFFIGVAIVLAVSVFLMYKSIQIARKLHYYSTLQSNNERLIKENNQLLLVHTKIMHMDSIAAYLEKMAAMNPWNDNPAAVKADAAGGKTPAGEKTAALGKMGDSTVDRVPSLMPLEGWITQGFSKDSTREGGMHPGIDIAAPAGKTIQAPASGIVETVLQDVDYGTMVVLRHKNGFVTRYGHCEKAIVSEGEKVVRGQVIALVGNTGRSTAPHLHYEVIQDGQNVDPQRYIKPRGKKAE